MNNICPPRHNAALTNILEYYLYEETQQTSRIYQKKETERERDGMIERDSTETTHKCFTYKTN